MLQVVHVACAATYYVGDVLVPPASFGAQFCDRRPKSSLGRITFAFQFIADFARHASDNQLLTRYHALIYSGDDYPR